MNVPAIINNEDVMIDVVAGWISDVRQVMLSEPMRAKMRRCFDEMLDDGIEVVEFAKAGSLDADRQLRYRAANLLNHYQLPPTQIIAYAVECLLQPIMPMPVREQTFLRDAITAAVAIMAMRRWPEINFDRGRKTKMSICYLVAQAWARHAHKISIAEVARIHRRLAGLIVRLEQ